MSGEATRRWIREQRDRSQEIRLDIRGAVYRTVARTGGHKEFGVFRARYLAASRAEEKRLYLSVLACFTDFNVIKQLLDWSMSDAVKLQDRTLFIASIAESSPEGRNAAWRFFKTRQAHIFCNKIISPYKNFPDIYSGVLLTQIAMVGKWEPRKNEN